MKKKNESTPLSSWVTESQLKKNRIKRVDLKRATGVDAIPPKLVKAAAPVISRHIASIANKIQTKEAFPTKLKSTQVTPIYRKGCTLQATIGVFPQGEG